MEPTYKKENMPLFKEQAKKEHPATSHKRAAFLSGSGELCQMMKKTLYLVYNYPGKTAAELQKIMWRTGNYEKLDHLAWPHKCMSRLEDEKLVRRIDQPSGQICFITPEGKRKLKVK